MGLDIGSLSKAVPIECSDDTHEETHYSVGSTRKRGDGLKPGCYVIGKGGHYFDFYINYHGYNNWRRHLSLLALGVEPDEVWEHPRRFRGKPFVELIDFPDSSDGQTIGPKTAAKLHADFVAFAAKAKRYYHHPPVSASAEGRPVKPKPHYNRGGFMFSEKFAKAIGCAPSDANVPFDTGGPALAEKQDLTWMWDFYCYFRRAFRLAKNGGLVNFG